MPRSRLAMLLLLSGLPLVSSALAQAPALFDSAQEARRALDDAQSQGEAARRRAERLEARAGQAAAAADRTAQEGAALAARIQEAEAQIAANEARIVLIGRQQAALRADLARRQRPLVELTAALQRMSLRPMALSLLRGGSLSEAVYLRATMAAVVPEVEQRTAGVRAELARARALEQAARDANARFRAGETQLAARRRELGALEAGQRLAARQASGIADREAERALALSEQARDLSGLVRQLDQAGALREQLAALPGPVIRPARPDLAQPVTSASTPSAPPPVSPAAPAPYMLPVNGRLIAGFGNATPGQPASRGITLAARGGAQAVAPAAGRVAFAGPYRGYGRIVIVEHGAGWTSLVTGLGQIDVQVGQQLVAGAPLGLAGPGRATITLELRHQGVPVNPLDHFR